MLSEFEIQIGFDEKWRWIIQFKVHKKIVIEIKEVAQFSAREFIAFPRL